MPDASVTDDLRRAVRVRAHRARMRREDRERRDAYNRVLAQRARALSDDQIERLEAICLLYCGVVNPNRNFFTRRSYRLRDIMARFVPSGRAIRMIVEMLQ